MGLKKEVPEVVRDNFKLAEALAMAIARMRALHRIANVSQTSSQPIKTKTATHKVAVM
jgi:hypothetical protein